MLKVKFYREVDYGADSTTLINDPFEFGNYAFGQLVGEYTINECSVKRSMTETDSFNFSIPIGQINSDFPLYSSNFLLCQVTKDGEQIAEGFVSEYTKNEDSVEVSCEDLILVLGYNRSVPHALFVDQQLISVIYKIANNYDYRANHGNIKLRLGDFQTLDDPVAIVDSDLREYEQAYEQLTAFIGEQPNCYIRYGGSKLLHNGTDQINAWVRTFDVGSFDFEHQFIYDEHNTLEISIEKQNEIALRLIEPYGEEYTDGVGDTQILQISDIVNHPDYPAILDPNYIIEDDPNDPDYGVFADANNLLPVGTPTDTHYKRLVKYYGIRPKTTENPSSTQLGKAALTLYKAVIRDFENEINDETEITLRSQSFPKMLMPGNKVKINYVFRKMLFQELFSKLSIQELDEFSLVGNFFVASYDLKYSEFEEEISLVLNRTGKFKSKQPEKQRKNLLNKQIKKEKNFFVELTPTDAWALHLESISSVASNAVASDGFNAYEFTVDTTLGDFGDLDALYLPTLSTTPVNNYFTSSNRYGDLYVETDLLTTATYGDTFTVRVHPTGRNWTISELVDLKILIKYEN